MSLPTHPAAVRRNARTLFRNIRRGAVRIVRSLTIIAERAMHGLLLPTGLVAALSAPPAVTAAQESATPVATVETPVGWSTPEPADLSGGNSISDIPSTSPADLQPLFFDDVPLPSDAAMSGPPAGPTDAAPLTVPPEWVIQERQSEKQMRFERIRDRLRALSRDWKQSPASTQPESDLGAPQQPDITAPHVTPRTDGTSEPVPPEVRTGDEGTPDPSVTDTVADPPTIPDLSAGGGLSIVTGPIDRIALADNLYALGEYTIALEMYSQVDRTHAAPDQRVWVDYQTACCLRKLDRFPHARERYRRLAAQTDVPWLADVSRWWLDRLDDRATAVNELQRIEKVLSLLKAEDDASNGK